ncbi:uncharacterized protein BP01DRAFT_421876 [Aspergillus saccharolyticus JOP 1030-1]|uniref:Uncharacterized protein n=1 Tax=Aspergillus saccharolyticus JOP 1030-1 TaxID=1450539 RepID=A0A318ZTA1_9EURO|nr:hypothetical protein BP01DRAFT_421876 [Aspergillus saccharolyticus JOP 1030-1]PYH47593.1 hypothetical protein BP01DRAFT_421876 [Aspergillus saccharolyticus JOP 1030-1]
MDNPCTTSSSSTPIPAFAEPLAPYLKSREEAFRIRQALTAYVRSHIIFAENDPENPELYAKSHLTLSVPGEAVSGVERIPPEVTGLRREYLEALQANIAARREYQSAIEKQKACRSQRRQKAVEVPQCNPSRDLGEYINLLRERRRNAKLQVFQRYLQELKERNRRRAENFEDSVKRLELVVPPELLDDESQLSSNTGENVEELMHKLEKAVIRAKTQFDREKELLEELKAQRNLDEDSLPSNITPATKVLALQRTRDELVHWVEEKLVSAGSHEESGSRLDLAPEDLEESARLCEEQRAEVAQQYAEYIEARKAALDAASRACQPIAVPPVPPSTRPTSIIPKKDVAPAPRSLSPMEVLSYTETNLLPLSKGQRAVSLQKFYLSGLLEKEKTNTLRMLNRLRDESHLLPEFPIPDQRRSNRAAAPASFRQVVNGPEALKKDEIIALAEAWAFASDEAGMNVHEYVEQKLAEGNETIQDARQALEAVCRTLNQDVESTDGNGSEGSQTTGVRMTRSRSKLERREVQPTGGWNDLRLTRG